jgi:hypothetical protein
MLVRDSQFLQRTVGISVRATLVSYYEDDLPLRADAT